MHRLTRDYRSILGRFYPAGTAGHVVRRVERTRQVVFKVAADRCHVFVSEDDVEPLPAADPAQGLRVFVGAGVTCAEALENMRTANPPPWTTDPDGYAHRQARLLELEDLDPPRDPRAYLGALCLGGAMLLAITGGYLFATWGEAFILRP